MDSKSNAPEGKTLCFKTVKVSAQRMTGDPAYQVGRSVFAAVEVKELYVRVEGRRRGLGEEELETELLWGLFRIEKEKSVCLIQKKIGIRIAGREDEFTGDMVFQPDEAGKEKWEEGIYGLVVQCDDQVIQSDPVYLLEGDGRLNSYLTVRQIGIDKCCRETEAESGSRLHSYRELDLQSLEDLRFYLLAENCLKREWLYEFVVCLSDVSGWVKAVRTVRGMQFVKDETGQSLLCFAWDFAKDMGIEKAAGDYKLQVYCFQQPLVELYFRLGERDIPYGFEAETAASGKILFRQPDEKVTVADKDEILASFYQLEGLRKVKEEVTRWCEYLDFIKMRRENGFEDPYPALNILFTGNPGVGQESVAKIMGRLLAYYGLLTVGQFCAFSVRELIGDENSTPVLRRVLTECRGGILLVENAGDFAAEMPERGIKTLSNLLAMAEREFPDVALILSDDEEHVQALENIFPDLKTLFPRVFYFEDYTADELMAITTRKLQQRQLIFSASASEKYARLLADKCVSEKAACSNGEFIDEMIEAMALRMAKRLMNERKNYSREELMTLCDCDIIATESATTSVNTLEKLDTLVGAYPLKRSLLHHLNYIYFILERQKYGFKDVLPPLNMLFCGNPGTGKLSVAKMLGEIYYSAGILEYPNVIVQNGRNLAIDNGLPPEQVVAAVLNSVGGGILYIEEVGSMLQSPAGLNVFEALLQRISREEYDGKMVILADNPDEISRMLELNPVLNGYFPFRFDFKDYSPEELLEIAERILKEKNYTLHPNAKAVLGKMIRKVYRGKDRHFGNALWVEQFIAAVVRKMSDRIMQIRQCRKLTLTEVSTVMAVDIPQTDDEVPGFKKCYFEEEEIKTALADLNKLVGQTKIKKQIGDFTNLARYYNRQGIKLNTKLSLQWCFTGNTGMGKKTLARIIARLYKAMGIITKAEVVHLKVENLIGQLEDEAQRYINRYLQKASGGILLFDEDSEKVINMPGLRERVRAILMNQMAEKPGGYMVFYVGQKLTVQSFKGEQDNMSDIINILYFEDYTNEELMAMLQVKLADEHMILTASARQHMADFIQRLTSTEERNHASARLVRMAAEWIIRHCEQRMARKEEILPSVKPLSVRKSDVERFNESLISSLMTERRKIGFMNDWKL